MSNRCPQCGERFNRIGSHWSQSPTCSYPELTDRQITIVEVLARKGTIRHKHDEKSPSVRTSSTDKEVISWLNQELGFMAEMRQQWRPQDLKPKSAQGFESMWELNTRCHPQVTALIKEIVRGNDGQ